MAHRKRSTQKILNEALDWLGNYPVLMRLESEGKPSEEVAEISEYAAAIADCNNRLWARWQRQWSRDGDGDAGKKQGVLSL